MKPSVHSLLGCFLDFEFEKQFPALICLDISSMLSDKLLITIHLMSVKSLTSYQNYLGDPNEQDLLLL